MPQTIIGCDLSRDWLDVHALPEGKACRVANTRDDIAVWLAQLGPDPLVIFEATSGCDRTLIAALSAAGIAYVRVNPTHARAFARATGVLAKSASGALELVPIVSVQNLARALTEMNDIGFEQHEAKPFCHRITR